MLAKVTLLASVLLASAAVPAAQAQTQDADDDIDCSTYTIRLGGEPPIFGQAIGACGRSTINHQILIRDIVVIPRVVANSFGFGPTRMEPAGLSELTSSEFSDRLKHDDSIVITPTADVAAAPAAATAWNVWADAKYTWTDSTPEMLDLDGPLWNGMVGADYKLTDRITFGVMGSYEASKLDGVGVELDSSGWGIGPYLGIVLTDHLVFAANAMGTRLQSSQFGGLVDYKSDRLQASGSLNGYWYSQNWRWNPGLSVSWSKEWINETSGFALPDQTVETAMLTSTGQLGKTMNLSETTTVEPWGGFAFDYVFFNRTTTSGAGKVDEPYADIRLQAGLNFGFGSNAQLALTGEYGGLLAQEQDSYSIEANFAYQF